MDLRLTVVEPGLPGPPVDLAVHAGGPATVEDLWPHLCGAVGHARHEAARLFAGGEPIEAGAVVGLPPLLEGAVVSVGTPGMTPARRVRGLLELWVVAGPDSGQLFPLPPGVHRLGRAAEATLRVDDPDISRVHAQVEVSSAGVLVRDLGSTNGTWLDGRRVGGEGAALPATGRLVVGSSTLTLRALDAVPAATRPDGCGHVEVNRSPRIRPPAHPVNVTLPRRPERRSSGRLPLLAVVLPLAICLPLAWFQHSAMFLMFGLMSPVMMVGSWASDRRSGRRSHAGDVADHAARLADAHGRIAAALAAEAADRRTGAPDHAQLLATVSAPLSRIWERGRCDEDVLRLRIGTGSLPSRMTVSDPGADPSDRHPILDDIPITVDLARIGVLALSGCRHTSVGLARALVAQVCGWHSPRDVSLVVLAAAPRCGADWTWTAYLPHTRPGPGSECGNLVGVLAAGDDQVRRRVAELAALLAARTKADTLHPREKRRPEPRVVVLLDGAQRLRGVPGLSELLRDGPAVGICFICLDAAPSRLPVEARATVHAVAPAGARLRVVVAGELPLGDVVADLVSACWAERFARAVAPLRDATPDEDTGQVPDEARLLDLLDFDATDGAEVAARWRAHGRSTLATLGLSATGLCTVDLRRDGPHVLVGGTTGSGKSELLQTLIVSLALGNRPDELNFVLVDYKGGSAFKDCARLPHAVGLVTDLDGHLTRRALASLQAELKRREQLLRAVGAKDIEDYLALAGDADPRLPRLLLVIDEFKMMAEELPGFLGGLVGIAAVGRSLGVHLVLATQRPGGIVSSDIKANVNLRIALRVRDRADSEDVIEDRAAAGISEGTPGRAYLRSGSSPLVRLQTARVGGHGPASDTSAVAVRRLSWETLGDPPASQVRAGSRAGPTDLARIVDGTVSAAGRLGVSPPTSPWLPPLPSVVTLAALESLAPPTGPQPHGGAVRATCWKVPYALVDLPDGQAQQVVTWDLEHDGHLAVAGTARTGRTTLLRSIAAVIADRYSPADVHLYGLDGSSGGLLPVAQLPHTGAVVSRDDLSRADRLVRRLRDEIGRRQVVLGQGGFGSLAEQRAHALGRSPGDHALDTSPGDDAPGRSPGDDAPGRSPGDDALGRSPGDHRRDAAPLLPDEQARGSGLDEPMPYIVLLIDGWDALTAGFEAVDHGRPTDLLLQVLRDGASVGVRVVLTGERSVLLSGVASLVPDRLALRMADPTDLVMAGVPTGSVPVDQPPGRAVRTTDGAELQIAVPSAELSGPAQVAALATLAEASRTAYPLLPARARPFRVDPLPGQVRASQIDCADLVDPGRGGRSPAGPDQPSWLLVGVGGDDLRPVGVDLAGGRRTMLVAGPPGSGRSTTLQTLAMGLTATGRPVALVLPRTSPLRALAGAPGVVGVLSGPDDGTLRELLLGRPDLVAVVDDAELLADSPCEEALVEMARATERSGGAVICAGTTAELGGMFRGLTVEVRKRQLGVLLNAGAPGDGELLGVRVSKGEDLRPGRGLLVDRREVTPVQVALPG